MKQRRFMILGVLRLIPTLAGVVDLDHVMMVQTTPRVACSPIACVTMQWIDSY